MEGKYELPALLQITSLRFVHPAKGCLGRAELKKASMQRQSTGKVMQARNRATAGLGGGLTHHTGSCRIEEARQVTMLAETTLLRCQVGLYLPQCRTCC